jgi:Domain of unknown function (DUF4386)
MPTPILATKLYVPPLQPRIVPRPRLVERLNEGQHRRLTLVSAPAGFGKTTLLRQDLAGADAASLVTTGNALVAIHDWTFLLGPGVMPGVNALLLGYLMYRSRLVPRVIPVMGLIGCPLILAAGTATLLGLNEQVSVWSVIATAPIFAWELSLGIWLIVKGFNSSAAILYEPDTTDLNERDTMSLSRA